MTFINQMKADSQSRPSRSQSNGRCLSESEDSAPTSSTLLPQPATSVVRRGKSAPTVRHMEGSSDDQPRLNPGYPPNSGSQLDVNPFKKPTSPVNQSK